MESVLEINCFALPRMKCYVRISVILGIEFIDGTVRTITCANSLTLPCALAVFVHMHVYIVNFCCDLFVLICIQVAPREYNRKLA